MENNCRNIYRSAREASGLSQERWATFLGVSAESVRLYESGRGLPSDEVVARMADVAAMPVLCYWHLKYKSGVANDLLPEVDVVPLPQAVVQLLVEVRNFRTDLDELLIIAADGLVDETESDRFLEILDRLQALIRAAIMVNYAERGVE
ncbi:MAG: helix-turn-helix transcriptional regulator [Oscillospiraceae bacterium]|nr:helix-turn-helix transcriptional regulator [Oscillospiraceae bacterium]